MNQPARVRLLAIIAAVLLVPVAAVASAVEIVLRRSGTVYLEARLI